MAPLLPVILVFCLEVERGRGTTQNNFQQNHLAPVFGREHGKENKRERTKRARAAQENSEVNQKELLVVGVQVNGRGPRTPCYSTIDDAARACRHFQTFFFFFS